MGFLDDIQSSLNKGVAATERAATTVKLKAQLSDFARRRQDLAAQLGASLYEITKDDPELRVGRESLYDAIASLDSQRASVQAQIEELERQAQAEALAAMTVTCPFCGMQLKREDHFCIGCGKSMAEITAALVPSAPQTPPAPISPDFAAETVSCPVCHAPVQAGDAFCMSCGTPLNAS